VFAGPDGIVPARLDKCTAGSNLPATLIFVGDSHATDLFPLADRIYADGIASVVNVSQPGCQTPALEDAPQSCNYADRIMRMIAPSGGQHILVIRNNYAPCYLDGSLNDFAERLEKFLVGASALGFKVVYVAPSPKYDSIGPGSLCSLQWYRPAWAIAAECRTGFAEDRAEQLARRRDVMQYLSALSSRRSNFFVFDPFDILCGGTAVQCSPVRDGRLIYRDSSHLTEQGSERLAEPFEQFLNRHMLFATRRVTPVP